MTEVRCSVTVVRNLSLLYLSGLLSSAPYMDKDESSLFTLYLCLVCWLNKSAAPTSNSVAYIVGMTWIILIGWVGSHVSHFTNHYDQAGELASLAPHVHAWRASFSGVGSIWTLGLGVGERQFLKWKRCRGRQKKKGRCPLFLCFDLQLCCLHCEAKVEMPICI